jgi:hypothetical protein
MLICVLDNWIVQGSNPLEFSNDCYSPITSRCRIQRLHLESPVVKKLLLATAFVCAAHAALADSIKGELWVVPSADFQSGSLTYNAPTYPDWGNALAPQASGDFAKVFPNLLPAGQYGGATYSNAVLSMSVTGTPIPLGQLGSNSNFLLFQSPFAGDYATFTILSANYSPNLPAGWAVYDWRSGCDAHRIRANHRQLHSRRTNWAFLELRR